MNFGCPVIFTGIVFANALVVAMGHRRRSRGTQMMLLDVDIWRVNKVSKAHKGMLSLIHPIGNSLKEQKPCTKV